MKCKSIISSSLLLLFLTVLDPSLSNAEIVIVVHTDNKLEALAKNQVIDIFMGRRMAFPDGEIALPLDHMPNTSIRKNYYAQLTGKTVAQVNAYWARLLFTGRATPPRVLSDTATILETLMNNKNAIAYLDSKDVTGAVKVIYRFSVGKS